MERSRNSLPLKTEQKNTPNNSYISRWETFTGLVSVKLTLEKTPFKFHLSGFLIVPTQEMNTSLQNQYDTGLVVTVFYFSR